MISPLISIITVVFNGEKHLEKTINSVLSQGYPSYEYIIIDGGSKDKTVEIINKYAHALSYWVSEPDNGIYDAFNKGVKKSNGDLVVFLNADDWFEPNALNEIAKVYQKDKIIYGNVRFLKNNSEVGISKNDHTRLIEGMTIAHPAVFVPKGIFNKFGDFKSEFKIAMDYELILRFFINGVDFIPLNKVITNMNVGGVSYNNWFKAILEDFKIRKLYHVGFMLNVSFFFKQFIFLSIKRTLEKLR